MRGELSATDLLSLALLTREAADRYLEDARIFKALRLGPAEVSARVRTARNFSRLSVRLGRAANRCMQSGKAVQL